MIENFKKHSVTHKAMLKSVFNKLVTEITQVTQERKATSVKLNALIADLKKQVASSDQKVKALEEKNPLPQSLIDQIKEEIRVEITSDVMASSRKSHRKMGKSSHRGSVKHNELSGVNLTPKSGQSPANINKVDLSDESDDLDPADADQIMHKLKETSEKLSIKLEKTIESMAEKNKIFEAKIKK